MFHWKGKVGCSVSIAAVNCLENQKGCEVHPKSLRKADIPWVKKAPASPVPQLSLMEDVAQHRHVQSSLGISLWWKSQAHLDRPVHSCVAGTTGVSRILLCYSHTTHLGASPSLKNGQTVLPASLERLFEHLLGA